MNSRWSPDQRVTWLYGWKPPPETMKYYVGVQWGQSHLMGEGAYLALVGRPSRDGITI